VLQKEGVGRTQCGEVREDPWPWARGHYGAKLWVAAWMPPQSWLAGCGQGFGGAALGAEQQRSGCSTSQGGVQWDEQQGGG